MPASNTAAIHDGPGQRRANIFDDLAVRFQIPQTGGAINSQRFVKIASDGDLEEATFNTTGVIGVYPGINALVEGAANPPVQIGRTFIVADQVIDEDQALKAAYGGRAIQLITPALSGVTIEDNVGLAFTNQPANDGVEIVSDNAADTTQTVTVYYTRNGQGDTVFVQSGLALNGTTQVVLTHTDVELVLAVEKSAATAGTITFREASGNATIITLAAGTLSSGKIAVTAGQTLAYNGAPTAVADAATTKTVGIIGLSEDNSTTLYASKALNGTTPVTFGDTFKTVTFLLVGDLESARTVTVKTGAVDSMSLYAGKALSASAARGNRIQALVLPTGTTATDFSTSSSALFGPAGIVVASKGVLVDSNKDIGDFRNVDVTNLDAGLSGTAGSVDVFPSTAASGKTSLVAAANAGDTTTTITNASQAGARTYTVPDAGASASFVMTEGAQTVNGVKTFGAASSTLNGAAAAAGSQVNLVARKTGIADNTATAVITVTVPNANHNAAVFLDILAHMGTGTDASESSRCATGCVVLARTTGADTVAVAAALTTATIATVSGGGTITLAYSVSSLTGAIGATQTFNILLTIVVTGTITDHTAVVSARLLNSLGTGVTMAAA